MNNSYIPRLVSVIIPVFNREGLVAKTIESILIQTYSEIEIILINDGSTDSTITILNDYKKKYPNKITIIDQQNTGQVVARNNGINQSRGEFIAFLDSDDTWLPEKLEKQIKLFKKDVGLVYSGYHEIDGTGNIIKTVPCEQNIRNHAYHLLLIQNRMIGGTVIVTKDALNSVGLFDERLNAGENWELWTRISKQFLIDYVDEPLVNYRVHDQNMSGDSQLMIDCISEILKKNFPQKPSDSLLLESYNLAFARYHYVKGVSYFSSNKYADARKCFLTSRQYYPGYMDTGVRIIRSYLGKSINQILSVVKQKIS